MTAPDQHCINVKKTLANPAPSTDDPNWSFAMHTRYIPAEFDEEHREEFDTVFMQKLIDFACQRAWNGYYWESVPPGISRFNERILPAQQAKTPELIALLEKTPGGS